MPSELRPCQLNSVLPPVSCLAFGRVTVRSIHVWVVIAGEENGFAGSARVQKHNQVAAKQARVPLIALTPLRAELIYPHACSTPFVRGSQSVVFWSLPFGSCAARPNHGPRLCHPLTRPRSAWHGLHQPGPERCRWAFHAALAAPPVRRMRRRS